MRLYEMNYVDQEISLITGDFQSILHVRSELPYLQLLSQSVVCVTVCDWYV